MDVGTAVRLTHDVGKAARGTVRTVVALGPRHALVRLLVAPADPGSIRWPHRSDDDQAPGGPGGYAAGRGRSAARAAASKVETGGAPADAPWLHANAPGAAAIGADPTPADEEPFSAAGKSPRLVAGSGVGYDHTDAYAARARGVRVTNTPEVLTNATTEVAVTLVLAPGSAAAARRDAARVCAENVMVAVETRERRRRWSRT
jgi:hypothetical protein